MSRFVKAGRTRLPLSDGDWIEVKTGLTYGESQLLANSGIKSFKNPNSGVTEVGIDFSEANIERICTWVVDWSLRDDEDRAVRFSRDAVVNLAPEAAQEILDAIDRHVEALEAEKKAAIPMAKTDGDSKSP